ncbi:MAG: class I SAM-dependent methyltransferase [Phycisphaerae bacterium]
MNSSTPPSDVGPPADPWSEAQAAEWYDRSINWSARFERELPLLGEELGAPGEGGLLDAGCGTGRHALALAARGYTVTGIDQSPAMLEVAGRQRGQDGPNPTFAVCSYQQLADRFGADFDGLYCLGNGLAAAGSESAVRQAIGNFAAVLRPGGKVVAQVLNFPPMRQERPCIRGPRVVTVDGTEYISFRVFDFLEDAETGPQGATRITGVTMWHDGAWQKRAHAGQLYPVTQTELTDLCDQAGLDVTACLGAYDRSPFDPAASQDLILIARRRG